MAQQEEVWQAGQAGQDRRYIRRVILEGPAWFPGWTEIRGLHLFFLVLAPSAPADAPFQPGSCTNPLQRLLMQALSALVSPLSAQGWA